MIEPVGGKIYTLWPQNTQPWLMLSSAMKAKRIALCKEYVVLTHKDLNFREGNGNPLQYSCLENPMDRGGWWAVIYGVAQRQTRLKQQT